MQNKIAIEMLTPHSVSIRTQGYVADGGTEYAVGQPHNSAYANSATDRKHLAEEVPEPYLSAILSVWGDTPTVQEDPA